MRYTAPTTTTTTTTTLSTDAPDLSSCRGIPLLDLPNDEYIISMIKDMSKGGVLFGTSKGRILTCDKSLVNAYLTGERKVFAEIKDGFGNVSDTTYANFFYALYNKIAEINEDKEIIKWKFQEEVSAIETEEINAVFLSPILYVEQDLGFWKQLVWRETKPADTDIIICVRSADSQTDLMAKTWDNCYSSNSSDVGPVISRSLDDISMDGKYIQFKVIMSTTLIDTTPIVTYVTITYSSKYAVYFFTTKFSLEKDTNLATGLITANITEPQNTEVQFGITEENTVSWARYQVVEPNKFFDLSNMDSVKVGIKMIAYDTTQYPEVAEFALLTGGDKDNLMNG
jgi:hypothetical protein